MMQHNKWILISFSVLLAVAIGGCTQASEDAGNEGICSPGDRLESGVQVTCVYKQEIIETGFDCPSQAPHQQPYGDYEVCSEQENLPPEFPEEMNDQFPGDGLPSDGCVNNSQCSGTQICAAGECQSTDVSPAPGSIDAGGPSIGPPDAGADLGQDGGGVVNDAGSTDAGPADPISGDAGFAGTDAGQDAGGDVDAGPPVAPCTDQFEPNDSVAQASLVTSGQYLNLTLCADVDYYALDLSAGDKLRVELEYDPAVSYGEAQMTLFDGPSGSNFLRSATEETSPSGKKQLFLPAGAPAVYDVPSDGRYYVLVSRFSGIQVPYELTVHVQ